MIEPHSAQLGASAWAANATLVPPRLRVIPEPPPEPLALPLWAWPFAAPLDAITVSSSPADASGFAGSDATAVLLPEVSASTLDSEVETLGPEEEAPASRAPV